MALLLAQTESPIADQASRAAAKLHQEVSNFTEELTLLVLYCPGTRVQCLSRNCETAEISTASITHWQYTTHKAQFSKEQRQVIAAGFRLYAKQRQRLLLERSVLQQLLKDAMGCRKDLLNLSSFSNAETNTVLDELMSNISQLNQVELSLSSLVWTTVCSPHQRAVLTVSSYPYWTFLVAGEPMGPALFQFDGVVLGWGGGRPWLSGCQYGCGLVAEGGGTHAHTMSDVLLRNMPIKRGSRQATWVSAYRLGVCVLPC